MAKRQGAAKVPEQKKKDVRELAGHVDKFKTICVVNMEGLPARQLQVIRNKVRDKATVRMSKKVIIQRALKDAKNKHAEALLEHLKGMPALLFSDVDAFELFQTLKSNQSPAAAKAGQISPRDIEIKAGPTSLTPGPAISTLSAVGLAAGVDAGKITIKKEKVIVKEGEEFTQPVVDVLNLLKIEPMKIGITLVAALQNEEIIISEVLDVDVEEFINKIAAAHSDAFKLAIGLNIVTPDTASFLITRAELDAKALATETGILSKDTAGDVLAKVEVQAKAIKEKLES